MRKALVTGGCGFIGSWIVKRLRERNVEVRVLAYPGEPRDNLEGVVCEFIEGDVRDPEVCEKAVDGCDTVFHAAAVYESWTRDPTRMYDVNMRGTFHIIEASRRKGVEKVIYTASIVSLGRPVPGTLANEHTAFEAWEIDFPYARSKYLSRELAEYFAAWGVDVRIVCPGVVIGPNDIRPTPSGELIRTSMTMKGPAITFAGGASYVDVRDAAEGHVLVALRGKPGERYVITAHNLSNTEFVQLVERITGRNRPIITLPIPIARAVVSGFEVQSHVTGKAPFISKAFFEYSLKPAYFSNEKARRELGMNFRPIEESIRDAAEWFRSRGMV